MISIIGRDVLDSAKRHEHLSWWWWLGLALVVVGVVTILLNAGWQLRRLLRSSWHGR